MEGVAGYAEECNQVEIVNVWYECSDSLKDMVVSSGMVQCRSH